MEKIYLINKCTGYYDDYHESSVEAYSTEEQANDRMKFLESNLLEVIKNCPDEPEEIEDLNIPSTWMQELIDEVQARYKEIETYWKPYKELYGGEDVRYKVREVKFIK